MTRRQTVNDSGEDTNDTKEGEEATKAVESKSDQRPTSHHGSCFFALPDGTGILYNLLGTAEEPLAAGNLKQTGPQGDLCTGRRLVEEQRLISWMMTLFALRVLIDVPALESADYKLSFTGFKSEIALTTVTFAIGHWRDYS